MSKQPNIHTAGNGECLTRRLTGARHVPYCNFFSLEAHKRESVPIAPLEYDLAIDHMKEAATTKAERVPAFEDRPLAIFEHVFDDAVHLRGREAGGEELPNGIAADDGFLRYLVIGRILGITLRRVRQRRRD